MENRLFNILTHPMALSGVGRGGRPGLTWKGPVHLPRPGSWPNPFIPAPEGPVVSAPVQRRGFGVPGGTPRKPQRPGGGVRVKGCPLCGLRTPHVRRHAVGAHLPPHWRDLDKKQSEEQAWVLARKNMKFMELLLEIFQLISPRQLVELGVRHGWCPPQSDVRFSAEEARIARLTNILAGSQPTDDVSVSPPRTIGGLLHWRTICRALQYLSTEQRREVEIFQIMAPPLRYENWEEA